MYKEFKSFIPDPEIKDKEIEVLVKANMLTHNGIYKTPTTELNVLKWDNISGLYRNITNILTDREIEALKTQAIEISKW